MAFSERVSRLKSSLIREILAAAQRPEVMSFAGGLPAEGMLPKVQWQAMQWIGSDRFQQHLQDLRSYYRQRRDAFEAALQAHFSDLAHWQVPAGGLFFWLSLKQPLDTRTLLKAALERDVAFMPGEPFFSEPDHNHGHLRLNFSHIDPVRLDEGLKRLATVIRQAQAAQAA